jgi:hypothetical protein
MAIDPMENMFPPANVAPNIFAPNQGSGDVQPPWADRWAANMVLTIQAVQRLHAAFDAMFVRSKDSP